MTDEGAPDKKPPAKRRTAKRKAKAPRLRKDGKPRQKPGPKPHIPTDESREQVIALSRVGIQQEIIADVMQLDPKTLRKHYRRELDLAVSQANAAIAGELYNKAMGGNVPSMIFWLKTRAGWSEKTELDLSNADGSLAGQALDLSQLPDEVLAAIVTAWEQQTKD